MKFLPRGLVTYAVTHPVHAVVLARAGWSLRRRRWWRHAPFLPIPDERYWYFRMSTATGDGSGTVGISEVLAAARWSLRQVSKR
jgi:hypothetical protein